MNDSDFIQEIARKWVELGGDSEGVKYGWKRLQEAVIDIEYAQQSVQRTRLSPSDVGKPTTSSNYVSDGTEQSTPSR